jgi:transposase
MRTIGIDLSVKGEHKAIVADEGGRFIGPILSFSNTPESLEGLIKAAQKGNDDGVLQAVMEPTGMAWFPVAVYLVRQGVIVYLANSQQVADLRRYYKKHAKSDRIDARVLAKLPSVNLENLHQLELPNAEQLACQRGCKQLDRLQKQITAAKNRLIALDRFAWPGLEQEVLSDPFSLEAFWFRQHWYNPKRVLEAGVTQLQTNWKDSQLDGDDPGEWLQWLEKLARKVIGIYGEEGQYVDHDQLQAEAVREQEYILFLQEQHHRLQIKTVRPLYRKLHPSRNLETIPGVGQDGACVYTSLIGCPQRFSSLRKHRGWSGMVPNSKQSADSQVNGLKITQAGPRLIKKFSYIDAETARQRDPQFAKIYYDQMVNKGKHHTQAICACATHLLDRVLVVLREDRPYQLQDVDGTPLTTSEALAIIEEKYQVPEEVRKRNNKRTRRLRDQLAAEKKEERRLRKSGVVAPKQVR